MTRRVEGDTPEAAADRLRARADWLDDRAGRSGRTSNDRKKCDARAMHLRSCAALMTSTTEHGDRVRARLDEVHALDLGWKALAEWVTLIAGELRAEATRRAGV